MELFEQNKAQDAGLDQKPLAERMRPQSLDEFVGQRHLLGSENALGRLLQGSRPTSLVFWGPPGTGKTTLARLLAGHWQAWFEELSAVLSGVADLRRVVDQARVRLKQGQGTVLFIDEIHRFNKAQQDALLPHAESGIVTLLGATTENPSFEIIPPLLSRLRVLVLHPLAEDDLSRILERALQDEERGLASLKVEMTPRAKEHLVSTSFGDARRLLGSLEVAAQTAPLGKAGRKLVDLALAEQAAGKKALRYDKAGDEHYNLISALHKSLRGSDPDAALYWLTRMLEAGEDPRYLLRRMMRFASEDVGLADPYALNQVAAALNSYELLGMPEAGLALAQAAVYLALAPKSNAIYSAYKSASKDAKELGPLEVPLWIRNAPTGLMKNLDYGKGYLYPHDYENAVVDQDYLPPRLAGRRYYRPGTQGRERMINERLRELRKAKAEFRARSADQPDDKE